MSQECPNCGASYSERVSVDMGDTYGDVFGLTPRDLLTSYVRVCLDPAAAGPAASSAGADAEVYLHTLDDLGGGGPFSD